MIGYVYVNRPGILPPNVTRLTVTTSSTAVRVKFRSNRRGTAKATFFKRSRGRYVRQWASSFPARAGVLTNKRIARALTDGRYKVEVVVTDADRVKSDPRSKTFVVD
jgi:hypothetical protein